MTSVRRRVCALVVLLFAGVLLVSCGGDPTDGPGSAGATSAVANDGPNIVLMMTDDMSLAEMRYLPKTRRVLAAQGVSFSDFTAPQPLCCPSRAQMLTGQYAQNNGVRHNSGPDGGYQAFTPQTAMPVSLQNAGYQTAMVGKYLNGYPYRHPKEVGWDHWDPTIRGIYHYENYTQYADGAYTKPQEYHTDYVAQQSEQLVQQMSGEGRPFFLWSSFVAPHGVCKLKDEAENCYHPPLPAPKYKGAVHERGISLSSPSFNERDVSDKPGLIRRRPFVKVHRMQHLSMSRADALQSVDDAVLGIFKAVRDAGQLDNTLFVFTSDNGYLLGQHRYEGKILGYEEAVKVPLVVRGLGLPEGVVDHQTAAMIDLAPTFEALAHATPLVDVDGRPIVARTDMSHRIVDRNLLIQAGVVNPARYPGGWWFRGVRTRRYTYIAWTLGFRELYDRRKDPYELRSVAGKPAYAATQRELARRTELLGACAGASCRTDFGPVPPPSGAHRHGHAAARG